MDTRSAEVVNRLKLKFGAELSEYYELKTGLKFSTYFSAFKIKWFLENHYANSSIPDDITFCTVDSWILWNLTLGNDFFTDTSNASRTFLLDLRCDTWDSDLLELFSIKREWLPEIKNNTPFLRTVYGEIASNFPFYSVKITAIVGDQQASLIGHWGKYYSENMKCTFGTGAFLLRSVNQNESPQLNRDCLRTLLLSGQICEEYPIICAGSLVEWMQNSLNFIENLQELDQVCFSSDKSAKESVYFNPNLSGALFPYWDPSLRGSFNNVTLKNDKNDFVVSVFESVAFCIRRILLDMSIKTLSVDGGMCANLNFCKLLANACNCEIRI